MKRIAALSLLLLAGVLGCAESTTGPVATPDELSKYNIPAGEMEKGAAEAAKAAAAAQGN